MPDILFDTPDSMQHVGIGQIFQPNPNYRPVTKIKNVRDDNWTGTKGKFPLFITDLETARLNLCNPSYSLTVYIALSANTPPAFLSFLFSLNKSCIVSDSFIINPKNYHLLFLQSCFSPFLSV